IEPAILAASTQSSFRRKRFQLLYHSLHIIKTLLPELWFGDVDPGLHQEVFGLSRSSCRQYLQVFWHKRLDLRSVLVIQSFSNQPPTSVRACAALFIAHVLFASSLSF